MQAQDETDIKYCVARVTFITSNLGLNAIVLEMSYVYFAKPIYTPMEFLPPNQLPVVYFPLNNVRYRFPVPVLYSNPPPAVL